MGLFGFNSSKKRLSDFDAAAHPPLPIFNQQSHNQEITPTPPSTRIDPQTKLAGDAFRLAFFGKKLTGATSCFIALPAEVITQILCGIAPSSFDERTTLRLLGFASSRSDSIISNAEIPRGSGLLGWVARHGKPVQVAPFEHDARTLLVYSEAEDIKSFLAFPIPIPKELAGNTQQWGVLGFDSGHSYAFDPAQVELAADFARELGHWVELLSVYSLAGQNDIAWQTYIKRSEELRAAIGDNSLELIRLSIGNLPDLEIKLGIGGAMQRLEQFYRLVMQSLPPHCPSVQLNDGSLLVTLDTMMTSLYEAKIRALKSRVDATMEVVFRRARLQSSNQSIEDLARSTTTSAPSEQAMVSLKRAM